MVSFEQGLLLVRLGKTGRVLKKFIHLSISSKFWIVACIVYFWKGQNPWQSCILLNEKTHHLWEFSREWLLWEKRTSQHFTVCRSRPSAAQSEKQFPEHNMCCPNEWHCFSRLTLPNEHRLIHMEPSILAQVSILGTHQIGPTEFWIWKGEQTKHCIKIVTP